jgi:hypothetical protein
MDIASKTGAVDDVYKAISSTDDAEKQAEGKKIIEQLGNLKYEMLHDRKLTYGTTPRSNVQGCIDMLTAIGRYLMMASQKRLRPTTRSWSSWAIPPGSRSLGSLPSATCTGMLPPRHSAFN